MQKEFTAIRLKPMTKNKLNEYAKSQEMTLSELLRKIIEDYCEKL